MKEIESIGNISQIGEQDRLFCVWCLLVQDTGGVNHGSRSKTGQEEFDKIVDTLPNGYRLIFVTPYDGNYPLYDNPVAEKQAAYERQLAEKYDFITIADWNAVAKANPQLWTGTDNIHFGGDSATKLEGAQLFAQTIKDALDAVVDGPVKTP